MHLSQTIDAVHQALVLAVAPLIGAFQSFSHTAAPVAVTALWQGMAVASCLAICLRIVPRLSPQHRFLLWSASCAALVSLPFLSLRANRSAFAIAPTAFTKATAAVAQPWFQLDQRWSVMIAALWIGASAVLAIDLVLHSLRLRRLWTRAIPVGAQTPAADSPSAPWVFRRRTAQICTTHDLDRPSVIGFFAPRILIPDWLFVRLTQGELDQIILHETEHLRRFDDWTNFSQKLCLVLFPLNPALWWIERRLSKEREMACDEAVIRITQAPRAYAACLASLAERGFEHRAEALSLGAWNRRSELVHRVHSILQRNRELHPVTARALLAVLGCSLLAVAAELAQCPQLVVFVPSQAAPISASAQSDAQSARLDDALYQTDSGRAKLVPGFYAVQAKAEMPMSSIANPFADRARRQDTNLKTRANGELPARSSEPLRSESKSRSQNLRSLSAKQPVSPDVNAPQQWIVFTAWEQTEIPASQSVSDYDTGATAGAPSETPRSGSNPQPGVNATTQPVQPAANRAVPVTRLIFRILPANPKSIQPGVVSFGDGWLVIQL
jgi:beta-lactamase regulating signal transducer with metallopeptidase domain